MQIPPKNKVQHSTVQVCPIAAGNSGTPCSFADQSMIAGYILVPHLPIASTMEGLKELPGVAFQLDIPQIMPVMSALVFSVLVGLAAVWTKARAVAVFLEEFQNIVLDIVQKVVIPILPFYIATTFCDLAWEGSITRQLPVFLAVILIVMVGHSRE